MANVMWMVITVLLQGTSAAGAPRASKAVCQDKGKCGGTSGNALLQHKTAVKSPEDIDGVATLRRLIRREGLQEVSATLDEQVLILQSDFPARHKVWNTTRSKRVSLLSISDGAASNYIAETVQPSALGASFAHYKDYKLVCSPSCGPGSTVPCALLLALHGFDESGDEMLSLVAGGPSELEAAFDETPAGPFCAAFPSAKDKAWDYSGYGSDARFLAAVQEHAASSRTVDEDRVSILGYSSGGTMALQLLCSDLLGARVASAVTYGAMTQGVECVDRQHLMIAHGTKDFAVPYEGTRHGFKAGEDLANAIVSRTGVVQSTRTLDLFKGLPGDETEVRQYYPSPTGCSSVTLLKANGADHSFPDAKQMGANAMWREALRFFGNSPKRCQKPSLVQQDSSVKACAAEGSLVCMNYAIARAFTELQTPQECSGLCERLEACVAGSFYGGGDRPICFLYGLEARTHACAEKVDLGTEWTDISCVAEGRLLGKAAGMSEEDIAEAKKAEAMRAVLAEIHSNATKMTSGTGNNIPWTRTLVAPYNDWRGNFVGGSEIMHLAVFDGDVYAINGYWMDSQEGKQAAQVLVKRSPTTKFAVNLDFATDAVIPPNMNMTFSYAVRGTLLKAIHVTQDTLGNPIDKHILIAAAPAYVDYAGTNGISIFTKESGSNTWKNSHILVSYLGQYRKTPRDIEVYYDPSDRVERIYMLAGNLGIVSGAYNSSTGNIDWNEPEQTSATGTFDKRPLGITTKGQQLFFSVGGQIWRRHHGQSVWTVAWEKDGDVVKAVGGIRGLSTLQDENAFIFIWAKDSTTQATIRVLTGNPDGGNLVETTEIGLQDVYNDFVRDKPGTGRALYCLGGYNQFFEVTCSGTNCVKDEGGTKVYITGFQASVTGANADKTWNGYYAGALYSIRKGAGNYQIGEVDGPRPAAAPPLVAPRDFQLSPFAGEEQVLYVAGFDANFFAATNTAWIYKVGFQTALEDAKNILECGICIDQPGMVVEPDNTAGLADGHPYSCKEADDYLKHVAPTQGCTGIPDLWIHSCCRPRDPTPAPPPTPSPTPWPTPAPTPSPTPKPHCSICPDPRKAMSEEHFIAGRDEHGDYSCREAEDYLNQPTTSLSCDRGRSYWTHWCCHPERFKCILCPKGLLDLDPTAIAGRFNGVTFPCSVAHGYMQASSHNTPCSRAQGWWSNKCCHSSLNP